MAELLVFPQETVLRAIEPDEAIERVRDGFVEYAGNEWQMPPKVYLDASPNGDFRAMPAKGAGLAILKWVTSFPRNPDAGLPVVMGVICVSSAADGEPLALVDVRAVTALRTGAVAAGATREEALACDVVTCVTPGNEPVVQVDDLRPGLHLNMLGADGPGKAEADPDAVAQCALFCDEWEQASHGGELTGAVEQGLVTRDQVTDLGAVLTGEAAGRPGPEAVTLFDS